MDPEKSSFSVNFSNREFFRAKRKLYDFLATSEADPRYHGAKNSLPHTTAAT